MKAFIIVVFSIGICWAVGHFVNLEGIAFHLAGVPVSYTMLVFCGALGLVYGRVK